MNLKLNKILIYYDEQEACHDVRWREPRDSEYRFLDKFNSYMRKKETGSYRFVLWLGPSLTKPEGSVKSRWMVYMKGESFDLIERLVSTGEAQPIDKDYILFKWIVEMQDSWEEETWDEQMKRYPYWLPPGIGAV